MEYEGRGWRDVVATCAFIPIWLLLACGLLALGVPAEAACALATGLALVPWVRFGLWFAP